MAILFSISSWLAAKGQEVTSEDIDTGIHRGALSIPIVDLHRNAMGLSTAATSVTSAAVLHHIEMIMTVETSGIIR
jgi:hypothetical protein